MPHSFIGQLLGIEHLGSSGGTVVMKIDMTLSTERLGSKPGLGTLGIKKQQ